MIARALPLTAMAFLASCTELPDQGGVESVCQRITMAEFTAAKTKTAWRRVDVTSGNWDGEGAGASRRRCWPKGPINSGPMKENRRCVQRNDLVIEAVDSTGPAYYRVPAGVTYKLYGREGRAVCSEIYQEN